MAEFTNGGRERAYEALRESEELHRATLSHISDAVFLTDDAGLFTYICPNVNVIFGYVPDEVRALTRITTLLGENLFDRDQLAALGEIHNIECDIRTKFGDERHLLIHVKSVSIKNSTVLYSCRDITERARAQEELRVMRLELAHASRLALAGELMASITHEVKQPLAAIMSNAGAGQMLVANVKNGEAAELGNILSDIVDEARLAADIMNRPRGLVRKQPLKLESLDLSQLVLGTLTLLKGEFQRRRVAVETGLAAALPPVEADRVSLQQVLLNLVVNAMEAMDGTAESKRQLLVGTRETEGAIEIVVSDNGNGLPTGRVDEIFEPFFTTKQEGIGLGLVIARSIVEAHSGRLSAENRAGGGATFRVSFPVQPTI